jgi:hypothetical protein
MSSTKPHSHKQLTIIFSSFKCDKNCPFCTAKITKWPVRPDCLELLDKKLLWLQRSNFRFKYLIISGNGEPSFYSLSDLALLIRAIEKYRNMFQQLRIQTSGNLFRQPDKWELFAHGYVYEVSRVAVNNALDMTTLHYDYDYTSASCFPHSPLWLNYITAKNITSKQIKNDFDYYIDRFSIKLINAKLMNLNTLDGSTNNRYSQWIRENSLTEFDADFLIKLLDENFDRSAEYDPVSDEMSWIYRGKRIVLFTKRKHSNRYGTNSICFYGGELIDYKMQKIQEKNHV